ncbi:MAG: pilin [Patescibacteria group bacterium]
MKKLINIIAGLSLLFILASTTSAQLLDPNSEAGKKLDTNSSLIATTAGLGQTSLGSLISTIIQAALGLLGAIFVVLMIAAGFQWMTAGGNEAQVKKAQDTIKTAIIGLVIVVAAYAITYFVFKYIPFSGAGAPQGTSSGVH